MNPYPSITTVWARDPDTNYKTLIEGEWAQEEFGFLSSTHWVGTEKVDGTNIRIVWDGFEPKFGGRTDKATIPQHLREKLTEMFPPGLLKDMSRTGGMTLYGEGFGEKIQKGGEKYGTVNFILFDVLVDIDGQPCWLEQENVSSIAAALECPYVPTLYEGGLWGAIDFVQGCECKSKLKEGLAEGLVLRPRIELRNRRGHRVITKLKVKDFAVQEVQQ